jgi:hypothetical protein
MIDTNTLCLRRLCLPSNTNIDDLHNGKIKNNMCICGNYLHIACIYEGKGQCLKCPKLWDKYV